MFVKIIKYSTPQLLRCLQVEMILLRQTLEIEPVRENCVFETLLLTSQDCSCSMHHFAVLSSKSCWSPYTKHDCVLGEKLLLKWLFEPIRNLDIYFSNPDSNFSYLFLFLQVKWKISDPHHLFAASRRVFQSATQGSCQLANKIPEIIKTWDTWGKD